MSLIALATAKAHLRLESDYPDEQVQGKLDAAEQMAAEFLNRRLFADAAALTAAIADLPASLVAAKTAYDAALVAADLIDDCVAQRAAKAYALRTYRDAQTIACETYAGIVMNAQIEAAVMMTLGHLFENRQDNVVGTIVAELKTGVQEMLFPFRIGLGV